MQQPVFVENKKAEGFNIDPATLKNILCKIDLLYFLTYVQKWFEI